MTSTASGGCLCGDIRFEASGEPLWICHCHCNSCRRNTASPMTTWIGFSPEQVRFSDDRRSFYGSSPGVRRGFCARCGTPVSYQTERHPDQLHLYVASLDNPEDFPPRYHVYYSRKIEWLHADEQLPRHLGSDD